MTTEVGKKGVGVRTQSGDYVFYPGYDPKTDDQAAAIPLKNGDNFLIGMVGNSAFKTADKPLAVPVQGGQVWALKDAIPLPIKITSGVATQTVPAGYQVEFGTFNFYWDGTGSLYLSGSSTGATSLSINDGIGMENENGFSGIDAGSDTTLTSAINITSWCGFAAGNNTVSVKIGNNYGTTVGCGALYIVQV